MLTSQCAVVTLISQAQCAVGPLIFETHYATQFCVNLYLPNHLLLLRVIEVFPQRNSSATVL